MMDSQGRLAGKRVLMVLAHCDDELVCGSPILLNAFFLNVVPYSRAMELISVGVRPSRLAFETIALILSLSLGARVTS